MRQQSCNYEGKLEAIAYIQLKNESAHAHARAQNSVYVT